MKKPSQKDLFWLNHIKKLNSSGLTQAMYCAKEGLNLKTLSARKSALSKNYPNPSIESESNFIPLKSATNLKFKLASGHELEFFELPDATWFGSFISALGMINDQH